jgi:pimeloyl-ACP methyl ester carboxylesterase
MSAVQNYEHGSGATQRRALEADLSVAWVTETFYVMTSGAPAPFPVKVLHGYRRDEASTDKDGQTVLAVHGLMHNALVFQPLGEELLGHPGKKTAHFYAISLPGHGDMTSGSTHGVSGFPGHRLYGEVTLEDYAEALIQVAEQIGRVDTIVAHSQGGMVVQVAETMLQDSGSSFRTMPQTRTRRIVLLSSITPREVSWEAADSGVLAQILGSLDAVKAEPGQGAFLSISDAAWYALFYSNPALANPPVPVPGGPDLATKVPHLRSNAPSASSFNALGLGQERPSIPEYLFEEFGFSNIAFEGDAFLSPADLNELGNYLKPGTGYTLIASQPDAPAIHCALYTRPAPLVPYVLGDAPEKRSSRPFRVAA